ncbi:MAG: N-acetyltransferase [Anaerolineales bacterium]|nr:N-acetyltransferase [Anaerolineales bacterium]
MSEILQDLSVPALVTAIEENWFEHFRLFRYWSQAEVHDGPDLLWTISDIPFIYFNGVLRAQLVPEDVDATIEAATTRCRSRNVPLLWLIGPATRPANLGEYLEAHGVTYAWDSIGMAADLLELNEDLPAPTGLTIELASDVETLREWSHVVCGVFEWPKFVEDAWVDFFVSVSLEARLPVHCYLGWLDGEAVATSYVILAAGVAGIYGVVTVPEARRHGIGAAIVLAPLREARALGYRVGILHASEMGFSVYHRIGFREYCKIGNYIMEK